MALKTSRSVQSKVVALSGDIPNGEAVAYPRLVQAAGTALQAEVATLCGRVRHSDDGARAAVRRRPMPIKGSGCQPVNSASCTRTLHAPRQVAELLRLVALAPGFDETLQLKLMPVLAPLAAPHNPHTAY